MPPPETLTARLTVLRRAQPSDAQSLYLSARDVLARSHWGRGLARDAASAVVDWLNGQSEIVRIRATVDVENVRSRRLLERLDLRLEGILRMATVRPNIGGLPRDTAIYGRIKSVS